MMEYNSDKKAWIVSALMGLGHIRAAYALKDIALKNILLYGSDKTTTPKEYALWKKIRKYFYFMSTAGRIPFIGKIIKKVFLTLLHIDPYYPVRDRSKANFGVKFLDYLIRKKNLGAKLNSIISKEPNPVINTFYATSIALDRLSPEFDKNYLLICDADFNRIWVPANPSNSNIKYLAPCTKAKQRLLSYGVKEDKIFITGFPLPKSCIGSVQNYEVLKYNLKKRLIRLDPAGRFLNFHSKSLLNILGLDINIEPKEKYFYLTFAVGGAGAQCELAKKILLSFKQQIKSGNLKLNLSAGIRKDVFEKLLRYINQTDLAEEIDKKNITLIYDHDIRKYLDKFNYVLTKTDVLWTKPSELSFYCALGIPILLAPAIGAHEELNRKWLYSIHAAIDPAGPIRYANQWLFDLRNNGRLAEAAWDGFTKARKFGTYKIENLIKTGEFKDTELPLNL